MNFRTGMKISLRYLTRPQSSILLGNAERSTSRETRETTGDESAPVQLPG